MKSPTYILKSIYHERNQQRDLEFHQRKLDEIHQKVFYYHQFNLISHLYQLLNKNIVKFHRRYWPETKVRNQHRISVVMKYPLLLTTNIFQQLYERSRENQSLVEKMLSLQEQKKRSVNTFFCNIALQGTQSKQLSNTTNKFKREEQNRIIEENFNMARRMINLPSVINARKMENDFQKHKSDVNLMSRYHILKQKENKNEQCNYQLTAIKYINQLTKSKFLKTQICSNISYLYPRMKINQSVILIQILDINLIQNHQNNTKNIPNFFWEITDQAKTINISKPQQFEQFKTELLEIFLNSDIDISLTAWKVKSNNEFIDSYWQNNHNLARHEQSKLSLEIVWRQKDLVSYSYFLFQSNSQSEVFKKSIDLTIDDKSVSVGIIHMKLIQLTVANYERKSVKYEIVTEPQKTEQMEDLSQIKSKENDEPQQQDQQQEEVVQPQQKVEQQQEQKEEQKEEQKDEQKSNQNDDDVIEEQDEEDKKPAETEDVPKEEQVQEDNDQQEQAEEVKEEQKMSQENQEKNDKND